MDDLEKYLQKFEYSDKAEKTLKEFSNWILGISIGMCALFVSNFQNFEMSNCIFNTIFKITILLSLLNTLFIGFIKYLIYVRDLIINITDGTIKKKLLFAKINNTSSEDLANEVKGLFEKRSIEFNKIEIIGKIFNYSLLTTLITILLSGVVIVFKIFYA